MVFTRKRRQRPTSRRLLLPLAVASFPLVVVACGGAGGQAVVTTTSTSAPPATTAPSGSTSTTTSPTEGLAAPGIVAGACGSGTPELVLIDPITGAREKTQRIPTTAAKGKSTQQAFDSLPVVCTNGQGQMGVSRDAFSPDWRYVASAESQPEPNGAQHVGLISLATGQLIDITAETSSQGFSSTINVDGWPVFDELTGDFWFERSAGVDLGGTFYDCPPPYTSCTAQGTSSRSAPFQVANGTVVLDSSNTTPPGPLINQAGTVQAQPGGLALNDQAGVVVRAVGTVAPLQDGSAPDPQLKLVTYGATPFSCVPAVWATTTSLICTSPYANATGTANNSFYLIPGATPTAGPLQATEIIPDNQRTNTHPVVDPTGGELAFVSQTGSEAPSLYDVPITGGPVSPEPIPKTDNLTPMAWQ